MTQKPRERSASQSRNQSAVFLASPHMDWRPFPLLAGRSFVPPETSKSPAGAETGRSRRPHVNAGRKAGQKQAQWQEAHGEPGWRRRPAGQCATGAVLLTNHTGQACGSAARQGRPRGRLVMGGGRSPGRPSQICLGSTSWSVATLTGHSIVPTAGSDQSAEKPGSLAPPSRPRVIGEKAPWCPGHWCAVPRVCRCSLSGSKSSQQTEPGV